MFPTGQTKCGCGRLRGGFLTFAVAKRTFVEAAHAAQEVRELHRDDELRRRGPPERLERVQVLKAHGLRVDLARGAEDRLQGLRVALGLQDCRLPVAFGDEDGRLLLAL